SILYHQDPLSGNWIAPNAEPMTVDEFQEWRDENPEAKALFDQAMSTLTAIAPSTQPPTPTLTLTLTPTPPASPTLEQTSTPTSFSSGACFQLLQPPSGASLPKSGQVTFKWESQPGAQSYVMTFVDSTGRRAKIE